MDAQTARSAIRLAGMESTSEKENFHLFTERRSMSFIPEPFTFSYPIIHLFPWDPLTFLLTPGRGFKKFTIGGILHYILENIYLVTEGNLK